MKNQVTGGKFNYRIH